MGRILKRIAAILTACILTASCFLLAADPKITLEQQAAWLQARAELAEARLAVAAAEAKINAIVANMQAVCPLALNNGRPECAPQPEAKKATK